MLGHNLPLSRSPPSFSPSSALFPLPHVCRFYQRVASCETCGVTQIVVLDKWMRTVEEFIRIPQCTLRANTAEVVLSVVLLMLESCTES